MIRKFLELSNYHIDKESKTVLEIAGSRDAERGVIAHDIRYGWLMWVPNNPEESTYDTWPKCLRDIATFARSKDCDYVLFDSDADTIEELPQFPETWDEEG